MVAASTCPSTTTERQGGRAALRPSISSSSSAWPCSSPSPATFSIWSTGCSNLPPAAPEAPVPTEDLPRVLVQIPVYNEPLVVERVRGRGGGARLAARPADDPASRRQHRHHLRHRRSCGRASSPRRRRRRPCAARRSQRLQGRRTGRRHGALRCALCGGVRRRLRSGARTGCAAPWRRCSPTRRRPSCRPASNGATAGATG